MFLIVLVNDNNPGVNNKPIFYWNLIRRVWIC